MLFRSEGVSIHAPAWGATIHGARAIGGVEFQFTRPRGARRSRSARRRSSGCFNSRARVGRDRLRLRVRRPAEVSIHAPAWGATTATRTAGCTTTCFNSRARVGRDGVEGGDEHRSWFQFTRPRGARRPSPIDSFRDNGFNSRARVGRDVEVSHKQPPFVRFNSRARVGRDPVRTSRPLPVPRFQFTRPRGARRSEVYHTYGSGFNGGFPRTLDGNGAFVRLSRNESAASDWKAQCCRFREGLRRET